VLALFQPDALNITVLAGLESRQRRPVSWNAEIYLMTIPFPRRLRKILCALLVTITDVLG